MSIFLNLTKKLAALMIVLSLGLALSPFPHAKQAQAGGLGDFATEHTTVLNHGRLVISTAMETISAAATQLTAFLTGQLQLKEYILDPIAWAFAKGIVSRITNSLVQWINSGFQGRPSFISELDTFLLEQIDATAGAFLQQLAPGLAELVCNPFALDIQIALSQNYQRSTLQQPQQQCTISDVVNNVEGFLSGNYLDGGLPGMIEISNNPSNTPFGGYLEAQVSFNSALGERSLIEAKIVDFGEGFLSQRQCDDDGNNCRVVTPGQIIEESLNFQLSTGQRSLIGADEFNEIIGALLAQLFNTAIQGVGGLLGLTESSYTSPAIRQAGTNFLGGGGTQSETFDLGSLGTALDDAITEDDGVLGNFISIERTTDLIIEQLEIQNRAANAANNYVTGYAAETDDRTAEMDQGLAQANALAVKASDASSILTDLLAQANAAAALPDGPQKDDATQTVSIGYAQNISRYAAESEIQGLNTLTNSLF